MNTPNYDALKLENQLCFPLYAASREVIKQYRPYLDELDLTYTQYIAMMVLWETGSISARDLGRRLYLDSGTLTPVLKGLAERGYISRRRSEKDERVLIAELTERGKSLRDRALSVPAQVAGCIQLDTEEAAQLYQLLYKVLGLLEKE
jgi:DNA-binding MarR family transcriptional regulator